MALIFYVFRVIYRFAVDNEGYLLKNISYYIILNICNKILICLKNYMKMI